MKNIFLTATLLFIFAKISAQNIGIGTITPDATAALEIKDTAHGLLIPRMKMQQRMAITSPGEGLMVYQTDSTKGFWYYNTGKWKYNALKDGTTNGDMIYWNGSTWTTVPAGQHGQELYFCNGVPTWGSCPPIPANLPSVTICNQIWTNKNLDVSSYRNGDAIPQVTVASQWASLTTGAWCWYNNDSVTYSQYGKLYNWYAVNDPRGLAPQGWHVPSDAEWNILVKCLDPNADTVCQNCPQSSTAGGAMKEAGTSHWITPNTGATNSTGFTCLPGGNRYIISNTSGFNVIGTNGRWWSNTERDSIFVKGRDIENVFAYLKNTVFEKKTGVSVRLLKD